MQEPSLYFLANGAVNVTRVYRSGAVLWEGSVTPVMDTFTLQAFSDLATYLKNEVVVQGNALYVAKTNLAAGAWNAGNWRKLQINSVAWFGLQAEYDAIVTKDPQTLYCVFI
jgi:hypothetical protein